MKQPFITPRSPLDVANKYIRIAQVALLSAVGTVSIGPQPAIAKTLATVYEHSLVNPAFSVSIDNARTGVVNGVCVALPINTCPVLTSTANVIDNDLSNSARIRVPLGVGSAGRIAVQTNGNAFPSGTFAGVMIKDDTELLGAHLPDSLTISTYHNGLYQQSVSALSLFTLFNSNTNKTTVGFTTTMPFDEIQLNVASLINFDQNFLVYYAVVHLPEPNLSLHVTAPNVFVQGNDYDYVAVIENASPSASVGTITVTQILPAALSFVAASGSGFTCGNTSNTVICSGAPTISTTHSATLTVTVHAATLGIVTHVAYISGGDDPSDSASNPVYSLITLANVDLPNLFITMGSPIPALEQNVASVLPITVTNVGLGSTTDPISLTLTIPSGLTKPMTLTSGSFACAVNADLLECASTALLAPTSTVTLNIPITPTAGTQGTTLPAVIVTGTTTGDIEIGNNASQLLALTVKAGPPDLTVDLGMPLFTLHEGMQNYLPLTVTNIGNGPSLGVVTTTLNIPSGLGASQQFTDGHSICTATLNTVVCTNAVDLISPGTGLNVYIPIMPITGTTGSTFPGISATVGTIGEMNVGNNNSMPKDLIVTPLGTDTAPPAAPTIGTPTNGSVITTTSPMITGTAEISGVVRIYDSGVLVCTTVAEADGVYRCAPSPEFTLGTNVLTSTVSDPSGNMSPVSNPVTVTVNTSETRYEQGLIWFMPLAMNNPYPY